MEFLFVNGIYINGNEFECFNIYLKIWGESVFRWKLILFKVFSKCVVY